MSKKKQQSYLSKCPHCKIPMMLEPDGEHGLHGVFICCTCSKSMIVELKGKKVVITKSKIVYPTPEDPDTFKIVKAKRTR